MVDFNSHRYPFTLALKPICRLSDDAREGIIKDHTIVTALLTEAVAPL